MSEDPEFLSGDMEDIPPEFLDMDEYPEQFELRCSCEKCGFTTTLLYEEGEKRAVEDIAESIHKKDFPDCIGKLSF
jgi:hypothetical protein